MNKVSAFALVALTTVAVPLAAARDVVSPELADRLAAAAPDELVEAYLVMGDRLSLEEMQKATRGMKRAERKRAVPDMLKAYAEESQAEVRALLRAAERSGRAEITTLLWAGNAVVFKADRGVVEQLAALPGIDRMRPVVHEEPSAYQDVAGDGGAAYPFADDFESGVLSTRWTVATAGTGQVQVSGAQSPNGNFQVLMDSSVDSSESTASITVEVDLTGQTDVGIRFEWKEFSDEDDPEDGVFVSEDGVNYVKVLSLVGGTSGFVTKAIDLDAKAAELGFAYTSTFHVRFQWNDNFTIPTDGFGIDDVQIAPGVGEPPPPQVTQNIDLMQAPLLWEIGVRGAGVIIGNIDSGVDFTHPDLADAAWINPGEIPGNAVDDDGNGFVDDINGWDFLNNGPDVSSFDSHGTNTAGLMVGDGTNGFQTGMAPDGTMIACEIGAETTYWAAQQYLIDAGADVVSSSYSYKWPTPRPDYYMHRAMCEAELAAGMIHANSIGNQGQSPGTYIIPFNVSAPGNCPSPFPHPEAIDGGRASTMGCAGIQLSPLDSLYQPSGQGPSAWEDFTFYDAAYPWPQDPAKYDYPYEGGAFTGLLKPDMCTYTGGVMSTTLSGGYNPGFSGTSAATPQLGGGMMLLRDFQPEAMPRHVAAALELSAVDLGPAGKDLRFGAGKLQVFDAARRLALLLVADDQAPAIGGPLTLDLYGEAGGAAFVFVAADIQDVPGLDLNLTNPFFTLTSVVLDGNGEATIPGTIPNNGALSGLRVWLQAGGKPVGTDFGKKPFASVPEWVDIQ